MSREPEGHAAVVVVNHGSAALLSTNLAQTLAGLDARAVVVDNSPSQEQRSEARRVAHTQGWELLEVPNDGFGAGVNRGVERALVTGADVVLVLNPDLELDSSAAAALLADARAHRSSLVSPVITREDGSTWFSGGSLDLVRGRTRSTGTSTDDEVVWLSGACLAASSDAWRRLGGFDTRFFLYWEDVDLSWRAPAAGIDLHVRRDLAATHAVGGTQDHAESRRRSDVYYEQNCRNRMVFAAHHLDRRGRARWAWYSVSWARAVVLRGGRRQLLHGPGPLLAVLRGTCGGLAYAARRRDRSGAPA